MAESVQEAKARTELALRLADVLESKGVTAQDAELFGPGGRIAVAQMAHLLANGGASSRQLGKVRTPSEETWASAVVVLRHREITARVAAMAGVR